MEEAVTLACAAASLERAGWAVVRKPAVIGKIDQRGLGDRKEFYLSANFGTSALSCPPRGDFSSVPGTCLAREAGGIDRLGPHRAGQAAGLTEQRMYDFKIDTADKAEAWRQIVAAAGSLTDGEPDAVANMANVAALLWESLPEINWAGFYRNIGGELVLGPFQGRAACIRIPFGKGVCGAAAASLEPQLVDDVDAFPGHIACDSASKSELVVPLVQEGRLLGVLDLDSPLAARFDEEDLAGCLELARLLAPRLAAGSKAPAEALKKS
jgi:GAF domain-containing protein